HNVLNRLPQKPFLRRVVEPVSMLTRVPGAKVKRFLLSALGRRLAKRSRALGLPGCDIMAGTTDPACVADECFFTRWLGMVPGSAVELACHPGYRDETLIGRDCCADDACIDRRVHELSLLRLASFPEACRRAGFRLIAPAELSAAGRRHAA